jgi:hypothetical protein
VKLSRSTRLRFRLEQADQWIADYGRALAVVAGLLAIGVAVLLYAYQGEAKPETGTVVGFATYAIDTGDEPIVAVRMKDGRLVQLAASHGAVRACRLGDTIRLIGRPHSLSVDPRGCRGP